MHAVFEKALSDGSVTAHFDLDWDVLKYKLTQVETFDTVLWDTKRYAVESLRNGAIISDGAALWRYIDMERTDTNVEIFEGRIVLLEEIDPIFG